jgi:hypothetical protein
MKIPSLTKLYEEAQETLRRFPFVIMLSVLGSFFMIYLIEIEAEPGRDYQHLYNAVMCCGLGISFLLSITLRNEVFKLEPVKNYLIQGAGIVFLIAYYIWLPEDLGIVDIIRFILFALGFHFLVSFTAFMNKDADHQQNIDAFWRFNKLFFIRILTSVLFSGVLFAGLSIAILSFNELFDANIKSNIYAQLFFFILGVFNTWFFLAGIPQNLNDFYEEEVYPKALKLFTQFVLLPLVTIYLVILYLYMGKIIIQWNLPAGWVSYLILCFSIAGILSLLLVYPIRNYEENKWIKVFSKSFYIALLPLIVLLFIAILTRLFAYGITERRYFVFVLACWLAFISLYFLLSKAKNIKLIPISLCLLCFITSFGPWSAFAVSERSQMNRLEKLLTVNKILVEGKIRPLSESEQKSVSTKDEGNISSIIEFLEERNSLSSLQPWFDVNLDTIGSVDKDIRGRRVNDWAQRTEVMKLMGLKYMSYYRGMSDSGDQPNRYFNCDFEEVNIMKISDFDYYVPIIISNNPDNVYQDTTKGQTIDSNKITFEIKENSPLLRMNLNGAETANYDLGSFVKGLGDFENYGRISADKSIVVVENEKVKIELNFDSMHGDIKNGGVTVNNLRAKAFVKIKK